jgi:hypothetical protein
MTLPKVAVIGSCVSRDPFSRRFFPTYRERAELVFDAYQLAVPSLIRAASVDVRLPETVRAKHRRYIEQEMRGGVADRIIAARPDVIVVDFYADVHFGVTTVKGHLVTRNHMAFSSTGAATEFYQDEGRTLPYRGRFSSDDTANTGYRPLYEAALAVFLECLNADLPQAVLVVNSARFSLDYRDHDGTSVQFPKAGRFAQKNLSWAAADDLFQYTTGCLRLTYPQSLFVGSASHPWGLHPVHYSREYYQYFWDQLGAVVGL